MSREEKLNRRMQTDSQRGYMIKIKSVVDEKAQKSLAKHSLILYAVILAAGIAGLSGYVIWSLFPDSEASSVLLIFALPLVVGLVMLLSLRQNVKKMAQNNFINEYEFDEEFFNVATYQNGEVKGTHKVYYNELHKVRENDEYIFLYLNSKSAYIVAKFEATEEDLAALRQLLHLSDNKKNR